LTTQYTIDGNTINLIYTSQDAQHDNPALWDEFLTHLNRRLRRLNAHGRWLATVLRDNKRKSVRIKAEEASQLLWAIYDTNPHPLTTLTITFYSEHAVLRFNSDSPWLLQPAPSNRPHTTKKAA